MPFTLAHPAAVLPLLRHPFVPAALVAGALAPDAPYYLAVLGIAERGPHQWYGPLLNTSTTHHPLLGLAASLPAALALYLLLRLLRAPFLALLPARLRPRGPAHPVPAGAGARVRWAALLLLSALIGIATHVLWDALTHGDSFLVDGVPALATDTAGGLPLYRLLQLLSTVAGLALIGRHLWRRHRWAAAGDDRCGVRPLPPARRRAVLALLALATVLGVAQGARADLDAHRYTVEVDYEHPVTRVHDDGGTETTYPTTTVRAPWGTFAEGVLTGAAKRGGAALGTALVLYAGAWHAGRLIQRRRSGPAGGNAAPRPRDSVTPR
ncbi:DUF4184 family protein [Streptomyces harbinensis]|uniref:DUF4184 family protein n=1 Tax=Streptomyces harbinensis TaxID=1176198 RepID=A0A1I6RJ08_9ACTN|nr:DUF4184 family protein [Streptomyces harbinensis]SFS64624.1 protein of unknown function [Streptomyces harbinensis]